MKICNTYGRLGGSGRYGRRIIRGSSSLLSSPIGLRPKNILKNPITTHFNISNKIFKSNLLLNNLKKEILLGIDRIVLHSYKNVDVSGGLYEVKFLPSFRNIYNFGGIQMKKMFLAISFYSEDNKLLGKGKKSLNIGEPLLYEDIKFIPFDVRVKLYSDLENKFKAKVGILAQTHTEKMISIFETEDISIKTLR